MKIKTAVLHQNVAIPGIMAPNMYINPEKLPGIKFQWNPAYGLVWKLKDKNGKEREGFFPIPTCSACEVEVGSLWDNSLEKVSVKAKAA